MRAGRGPTSLRFFKVASKKYSGVQLGLRFDQLIEGRPDPTGLRSFQARQQEILRCHCWFHLGSLLISWREMSSPRRLSHAEIACCFHLLTSHRFASDAHGYRPSSGFIHRGSESLFFFETESHLSHMLKVVSFSALKWRVEGHHAIKSDMISL